MGSTLALVVVLVFRANSMGANQLKRLEPSGHLQFVIVTVQFIDIKYYMERIQHLRTEYTDMDFGKQLLRLLFNPHLAVIQYCYMP